MITTLDYNSWLPEARAAKTGCCNTDVNLDGQNTTLDYNLWLPNARAARKSQCLNKYKLVRQSYT